MYIEFWVRPDQIFKIHPTNVEDLAFCTTEQQANKVFDRLACKVPPFWRGHVYSECIRWVGSGISAGRRVNTAANFAPFVTVERTEEEREADVAKDAECGVNLDKARKNWQRYSGKNS